DYCGAQVLAAHPVPAIQQALSVQFQKLPGSYSIDPYNAGAITGYFEYFKSKFPDAIGSVGTIVGNQPAAVQSWKYFKATMESLGYSIKYEDDFPPAQTNFTADVVRMKSQGIKMVFIIGERRSVRPSPQDRGTADHARQIAGRPVPDPQLQRQRPLSRHRRRLEEEQPLLPAPADQGRQVHQGRRPAQGLPL